MAISTLEMRVLEENSEHLGVSKFLLMENAGRRVAEFCMRILGNKEARVLVVAGPGNNGGDGFVAARYLAQTYKVRVFLLARPSEIRTLEARKNWEILEKMRLSMELHYGYDLQKLKEIIKDSDLIVDAIFGTGLKGVVREPYKTAIEYLNSSRKIIVAVDVPSGLNPDTGEVHGVAVKASYTITFHRVKKGLETGRNYAGRIEVVDIGIPREAELVAGPGDVIAVVKPRTAYSKKGDFGRVLVIGGSEEYSGAPALAALSAMRTGADIVVVAAPLSVADIVRSFSPTIIVKKLSSANLVEKDVETLLALSERADSIILGPGLGLSEETRNAVISYLSRIDKKPLVVDADALKIVAGKMDLFHSKPVVLTPHAGEFRILFGVDVPRDLEERIRVVRNKAAESGTTILLKGHEDIISDGRRIKVNYTGNPGMTVGGTGDVLTGVLATFLAWSGDPFFSASAAAYINGLAGDLAVKDLGFHITALDVVDKIPLALRDFDTGFKP